MAESNKMKLSFKNLNNNNNNDNNNNNNNDNNKWAVITKMVDGMCC